MPFQAEKFDEVRAALEAVVGPSRAQEGVISYDLAEDITSPNTIVATEVFADQAGRDRQEATPEAKHVMANLEEWLAAPPEMAVYEVSPS